MNRKNTRNPIKYLKKLKKSSPKSSCLSNFWTVPIDKNAMFLKYKIT